MINNKILSAFVFFILISGVIFSQEKNQKSKFNPDNYSLDDCVNQFDSSRTVETKVGYQYWFVDKQFLDGRTLKMSVVKPHSATHAPHSHAEDEFFFVLEGTAEFILNDDSVQVKPYASFYCPPESLHGIRNVGDTVLKYLVIKKYIMD